MKRNIHKNLFGMLKSKGILAVSSGLLLISCGAQMGGYSETDGVYYDPNKDTLPEGVIINNEGNRVGEYYDYYQDDSNLIYNSEVNSAQQNNRYNEWSDANWNSNATDSDWGNFAGNETNYYDNSWGWGWGSPWGWGYNPYWGWGSGWGFGMSFGWGSPWGWGGFSPYWGMGWNYGWNNYWGYNPYWGGYYGNPYWGWGNGYWGGNYYVPSYRRSGANGRFGATSPGAYRQNNSMLKSNSSSGFRNSNSFRNQNSGVRAGSYRPSNNGYRNNGYRSSGYRNSGYRNPNMNNGTRSTRPNYNYNNQQQSQPRYRNDSGFRSGGFNSGSSSGGFRGGSSGGSMRSGGGGGFRSGGR